MRQPSDKSETILARLTALSVDHFNLGPDDVTWSDIGPWAVI